MLNPTMTMQKPTPGTNEWWLARLGRRLDDRRARMTRYEDYYEGRQPLAFVSDTFKMAFGDRFREFSSNFMSLVVDAHRERLQVQGIRFGTSADADRDAWDWWQANRLDAESQTAFTESLVKGIVSILVWPNAAGEPEASIESPLQMVVETAPGQTWKRLAAMKRWLGDDDRFHAELYLPDGIYKYVSIQKSADFTLASWSAVAAWQKAEVSGEAWPIKNPIGIVPVVPIINRPRLNKQLPGGAIVPDDGQSDIAMVMSNQDVINKLRADMVNASDLAAFRQRWLTNFQVEIDEKTGQPIEPFKSAVDRLWIVPPPDPEDPNAKDYQPKFGEFEQTDVSPIVDGIAMEVQHLGAISHTPYHYLLPQSGQPPSGESLKSAETGLVAKVRDSQLYKGEALEEVFRLNFAFRGDARAKDTGAEIDWVNPESRPESTHTDAMSKWQALGIPDEVIWGELGLSPRQIERIKAMLPAQEPTAEQIDAAGILVRSGYEPAAALKAVGLDPIKHTGLIPVTLQPPAGATPPNSPPVQVPPPTPL
jgi:hypothetical protein